MKRYELSLGLFLTVSLLVSSAPLIYSHTRDELSNYQQTELMAEDFSLTGLDGETYNLSDYRGKKIVVLQAGSST